METQALVRANKSLYQKTCEAIQEAARYYAFQGELNLHVFSNKVNPKIPKEALHESFQEGGASSVKMDPAKYEYHVSKNDNSQPKDQKKFFTHHHVAIFDI